MNCHGHSLRLSPLDDVEYRMKYQQAAALRDEAVFVGNRTLAKSYRQAISALYRKYEARQLPETACGFLGNSDGSPVEVVDLRPTMHLNSEKSVAVSDDFFWIEDMSGCPRGVKALLLGKGGVAVLSQYNGDDAFWVAWAPLPKRRPR